MLGLGAFGLAFSLTTTAAYLPPLLGEFTDSTTLIALVLAAEGLFALTLPLVIGPWSDTLPHAARPPAPVHARRARPDGLLPRAARVHAEPLDDGADRVRVLLRLLRLRAAVPRAVPGPAAGAALRPLAERPAPPARRRARRRAHRRRRALPRLGGRGRSSSRRSSSWPRCAAPVLFVREDGGHGRVFEGVRAYVSHSWRRLPRASRTCAAS